MTGHIRTAILGASGYTGAETIRILADHPHFNVTVASAHSLAGQPLHDLFPHLRSCVENLPLVRPDEVNWNDVDVVFSCLPHGASQDILLSLPSSVRIIDLSADFRLSDAAIYEQFYGRPHAQPDTLKSRAYGLTEFARDAIPEANIIACPGCYPTATLLALLPLAEAGIVSIDRLVVDAKSGASGAGRGLKEGNLFCEVAEGLHPYAIGTHRHTPEIEQELSRFAGEEAAITFTPHLIPMTRGELVTVYADLKDVHTIDTAHAALEARYSDEYFVHVRSLGEKPADTRHVRGSNLCEISVHVDRVEGRVILVAAIDNLIKGSGGQAIQNANVAFGFEESLGLKHLRPLFP